MPSEPKQIHKSLLVAVILPSLVDRALGPHGEQKEVMETKVTVVRSGAHRRRAVSGAQRSKGGEPTGVVD